MIIETRDLSIIPCEIEILETAIQGNKRLAKKIKANVEDNWTEFGAGALHLAIHTIVCSVSK